MENIKDTNKDFLALLMRHQKRIYSYIASLVLNAADADDIMQETVAMMWDKFGDYQLGTNFVAWGIKIAHFKILRYRRDKVGACFQFSDEAFVQVQERAGLIVDDMADRIDALHGCLNKLSPKDQGIIKMRYEKDLAPKFIADKIGRKASAVYAALSRIHIILQRCVRNTINTWEAGK